MFKFGTIGAFNVVKNNPRCKALVNLVNGKVVICDDAKKQAPTPATADLAKGKDLSVVYNIIDYPMPFQNSDQHMVKEGEYVRTFRLIDLAGLTVKLDSTVLKDTYSTISVDDLLVACDDATDTDNKGEWKKDAGTGYAIALKVVEKTTLGNGEGLLCTVVAQ